jgi:hypothetical protein
MSTLQTHDACPCCMFMLQVHSVRPWCMSMLHVYVACPCCMFRCMSTLHIHAARPFCVSMPHVCASYPCFMFMMRVHFVCPRCICMFILLIHAACSCCMSTCPCYTSVKWIWNGNENGSEIKPGMKRKVAKEHLSLFVLKRIKNWKGNEAKRSEKSVRLIR